VAKTNGIIERIKSLSSLEFIKTLAIVRMSGLTDRPTDQSNLVAKIHGKRKGSLNDQEARELLITYEKAYTIFGNYLGYSDNEFPWNCKCRKCGTKFLESQAGDLQGEVECINPNCDGSGKDIDIFI